MQSAFGNFDFTHLSPAERLLIAQELLDSVYDDVIPHGGSHLADSATARATNARSIPSFVEPLRLRAAG